MQAHRTQPYPRRSHPQGRGIDGQHHARLFDDPLIGQKLGVRLLMEVDAVQFRASREHIEVALPKLRRPFGSLLLMGYDADQPKGLSFSRRILMISAAYSPTPGSQATRNSVTPRWRSSMIRCAISSFMRRQPSSSSSKPHGNRRGCCPITAQRTFFFIIPPPLIVVYWLTISILTAAIFRVNENVSYKHTK